MDIEKKYGAKKKDLIILFILFILFIVEAFVSVYGLMLHRDLNQVITNAINIIEILGIGVYATIAYKKYSKELMSGLFLLYSVSIGLNVIFRERNIILMILILAAIILVSYMAGAIDKYKKNLYIGSIVFIIMFTHNICVLTMNSADNLITTISILGSSIIWLAIIGSYMLRHHLSKEE